MSNRKLTLAGLLLTGSLGVSLPSLATEPPAESENGAGDVELLTVEEARRHAQRLQKTYLVTLQAIHRRYFDEDERHPIPARVLEESLEEVDAGTQQTTGWIAVNTPAMNVDHEPEPGFESDAVAALSEGEEEFERVEDGVYRRAGAVPLAGGCLKCHVSALTKNVKTPRVAAFVIAMPVKKVD